MLADGSTLCTAQDAWQPWGRVAPPSPPEVHLYTDGSYDKDAAPPRHMPASWAVVLRDQWLDANHRTLPADEQLLTWTDVAGAAASTGRSSSSPSTTRRRSSTSA